MSENTPSQAPPGGISLQNVIMQLALMGVVFYLWSSPLIQPVKLMVVLFHEMSHGLMAIATGGKVIAIEITANEGGACETEGGSAAMIVSAGYLGSMLFGSLVLYLSRARHFVPIVYGILTLLLVAAIATVLRDSYSRTFASCFAGVFIVLGFIMPAGIGAFGLRALGTFACVYSIFDIYWDILAKRTDGPVFNDATAFSEITGVAPQMVGMAWLVTCMVFFLFTMRAALLHDIPSSSGSGGDGAAGKKAAPATA